MKVTVLRDKSGNIQSIAVLNPAPSGHFHVEIEGGGDIREVELDTSVIDPQALRGEKGRETQGEALEKLRRLI